MKLLSRASALAVGLVLLSAPATLAAQNWRSSSNPLVVYENGVAQGGAYGTFEADPTSNGAHVYNAGYLKDFKPTGNSIYHETNYSYAQCSGCPTTGGGQFQSTRWNGDYWRLFTPGATTILSDAWDYARGAITVCEDQQFSPDPCSTQIVTGYDYF